MRTAMKLMLGGLAALWIGSLALAAGFNGVYVWGGYLKGYSGAAAVQQSVGYALARGWSTVRIAITPGEMVTEGISNQCTPQTLACFAAIEFASSVWDSPNLQRIIITTQDWSCYNYDYVTNDNNRGCLYASDLAANAANIQAEYAGLLNYLATRFAGHAIQIILDNWEGDNFAYCGGASSFGQTAIFALQCEGYWPSGQTNAQRAAALVQWVGYRDAAVAAWNNAHSSSSLYPIISALQFNSLTLFCQQTTTIAATCASTTSGCNGYCDPATDTVLDQVTAAGGRGYCDYSTYDSLNNNALPSAAVNILARGCTYLILGEVGASGSAADGYTVSHAQTIFSGQICPANKLPNVIGAVIWNLIYSGTGTHWGMYNEDGSPQNSGSIMCMTPTPPVPSYWK